MNYVAKSEAEKRLNAANLEKAGAGSKVNARTLALLPLASLAMSFSAFATDGETTGMDSVTAQVPTIVTLVGNVFSLISGNAYLSTMMAFSLLGGAVWLFRRVRRSVR